jgi:hypothetical protein
MATAGGPPAPHGLPLADITDRMAVFGRLFAENVGLADPTQVPDARSLVELVQQRVPRTTEPADDTPVFEAAAFIGEWLHAWVDAAWIAEGPFEPHLQLTARDATLVYLFPVVSVVRVASTAGYDGLPKLLDTMLAELRAPAAPVPLARLRVTPDTDRARVVAWLAANRNLREATLATLWRRCQACATLSEDTLRLAGTERDWEKEASTAASVLARRPFACACGGPAGEVSRFLVLRARDGEPQRLADIYLGGTHTRIACWSLEGETATPLDASAVAVDGLVG